MENDYSIEDIFNSWVYYLRTEASDTRFLHRERPAIVSYLVEELLAHKVSYDDAKSLKNDVIEALTTKEGRKGKGSYSGWKEAVETDYYATLASYYVEKVELDDTLNNNLKRKAETDRAELFRYHPENRLITEWAKNKWGQDWTPEINKEAHLINGGINQMMKKEVFESDWVLNPQKYPDWYKKLA